jgi:ParB-like chromosome segregation protein Spo0J
LHTSAQIDAIARSIEAFGFNAPILLDKANRIVAGHGRLEAAKRLGLTEVPAIRLEHLSEHQAKAYMLADNKLTDRSSWDDRKVAIVLKELSEIALDFEIEATGFEPPEIDLRIQSLEPPRNPRIRRMNLTSPKVRRYPVPTTCGYWATIAFSAATPWIRGPMTHSSLERKPPPLSRIRRTMSG